MPSYEHAEILAERIVECNNELDRLFAKQNLHHTFRVQLKQIKAFYKNAFVNTSSKQEGKLVLSQYTEFMIAASEVQLGQISAEEAYEKIKNKAEELQDAVLVHNIFKVCELLFWAAVVTISYAACLGAGIPLLFLDPLLGFAVTTFTTALFFISLTRTIDCFDEFETFDSINAEHSRERDVISFFSTNNSYRRKTQIDSSIAEGFEQEPHSSSNQVSFGS